MGTYPQTTTVWSWMNVLAFLGFEKPGPELSDHNSKAYKKHTLEDTGKYKIEALTKSFCGVAVEWRSASKVQGSLHQNFLHCFGITDNHHFVAPQFQGKQATIQLSQAANTTDSWPFHSYKLQKYVLPLHCINCQVCSPIIVYVEAQFCFWFNFFLNQFKNFKLVCFFLTGSIFLEPVQNFSG